MKNIELQQKHISKISPLIQSVTDEEGRGFIGYTIQYEDWEIENRVYPYTASTQQSLIRKCLAEHGKLLKQYQQSIKATNRQNTKTS